MYIYIKVRACARVYVCGVCLDFKLFLRVSYCSIYINNFSLKSLH